MTSEVRGALWRAEYGEISERAQFRFGYLGMGSDSWTATFVIEWLADLISTLTASVGTPVGTLTRGTYFQARRVTRYLDIEPRLDSGWPSPYFRLADSDMADLISTLTLVQTGIGDDSLTEDDWDSNDPARVAILDLDGKLPVSVIPPVSDLGAIPSTEKAAPDGVATLDSGGTVPVAQVPLQDIADSTELSATFAGREPRDINLREAGVSPANTATVNQAAFEAAIAAAPEGSRLLLPYDPNPVTINAALTVQKMLRFAGLGGKAKIEQTVWGQPVFDILNADGCSIEDFDLTMSAPRALGSGTVRDGAARTYASAVWAAASDLRVSRIRAAGFTAGIRLTNWDDTLGARSGFASDCVFEDIAVDDVDWGVVGTGWRDVTLRNIRGSYSLTPSSVDPSHLVYVSEDQANEDVTLTGAVATSGTGGHAYQFKGVQGLDLSNVVARGCPGILSLRDVQTVRVTGLRSFDDAGEANGSIFIQGAGTESGITIDGGEIHMLADGRSIRTDGADTLVKDFIVYVTHTTLSEFPDISVNGTRNTLDNVRVVNAGTGTNVWRAIILASGSGHKVRGGAGVNVRSFVQVLGGVTDCSIEYDPKESLRNSVSGGRTISVSASLATTRVRPTRTVVPFATGAGAAVQIRVDECTEAVVTVSGASDFTVSMLEPFGGAIVAVQITNSSGGAMGTITWSGLTLASAWTNPAAGESKTIVFFYDGTTWRERSRA